MEDKILHRKLKNYIMLCDICERRKWVILCAMWYLWTTQVSDLVCYVIFVNDASEWSCVLCDICERRKWVILYVMWYMWATQMSDLVCYVICVNDASEWTCVVLYGFVCLVFTSSCLKEASCLIYVIWVCLFSLYLQLFVGGRMSYFR